MENQQEDVYKTLIVGKKRYQVNCKKFAAKSHYFDCLFSGGYSETYQDTITIEGIENNIFNKVYHFLNSSGDNIPSIPYDLAVQIYIACQYLLVKDEYLEPLVNFLKNNMDHISILELYVYCTVNKNWSLLPDIRKYVAENIEMICNRDHFLLIPIDVLIDIITQWDLKISQPKNFLRVIAIWLAKDPSRETHIVDILKTVLPQQYFNKDFPTIEEWTFENIFNALEKSVFKHQIGKPFKCWMTVKDEPLFLSRNEGLNVIFHYDGKNWTELSRPRIKAQNNGDDFTMYGVRNNADIYIIEPTSLNSPHSKDVFTHYNFRSQKVSNLRPPNFTPVKGLFSVNNEIYSCGVDCVRRYCPEYNMWLTPGSLNVTDSSLFASDGKLLYTCGIDDSLIVGKSIFCYDERCSYWEYLTPAPQNENLLCGGFVNDDLYVVDGRKIKKLDLRVRKWEEVATLPNTAGVAASLTQCHNSVTVLDGQNNTFVYNLTKCNWNAYCGDFYPKLNVVHCVN